MKKIIFLLLLSVVFESKAQTLFTFEDAVPSNWTVTGGTLSLTDRTYKEGSYSLEWTSNANSVINIPIDLKVLATNGTLLYVYSPKITNDTIVIRFKYQGAVKREARILCNFQGWREFNRTYVEYKDQTSTRVDNIEVGLHWNKKVLGSRKILFDNVEFNNTTITSRVEGPHMILDKQYLKGDVSYLELYASERDIPVTQPTQDELNGLQLLRERLARKVNTPTSVQLRVSMNFINALNIVENADGTLRGTPIDISYSALSDTYIEAVFTHLSNLSTRSDYRETFLKAVRYFLDQGVGEGCNYFMSSNMNFYTAGMNIPAHVIDVAYACEGELRQRLLDFAQWFSYYNEVYRSEEAYKQNLVSDYMYLYLSHFPAIAAYQTDDAVAVRELKAVKRYMERSTEYTPGCKGILKPDGTGFHHNTHYNNYMYSYQPWTVCMWYMRGTPFRIAEDAYERFKKAVLSEYIMATKGSLHYFANTFAGRNPFGAGITLAYSNDHFNKLIETGVDIKGDNAELKAAYNYFSGTNTYAVDVADYSGFYAFNYSPAAIFRKDNWVVSMRSITTKFWGAEIYSGQNRFGRYQSHGSLDVLYDGTVAESGYPTTAAGYDWNVVPGTTTVHYTSWSKMMPKESTTQRFDQFSKEKNFSGALAWNDCGVFATDFDQIDRWGGTVCYTSTNLVFKKTMFAFDDMVVCIGSDIASSGTYDDDMITATNLFQNVVTGSVGDLIVNGEVAQQGERTINSATTDNWFITPAGTGYFVPKGNDPIVLKFGEQSTPNQTGADCANPTTALIAAKAYINHGVKPSGAKDVFVLLPATTTEAMSQFAMRMRSTQAKIFTIESQTDKVHALTYLPNNTTAYAFYDAVSDLDFGIVKATTFRHLLMVKRDVTSNRYKFAVCNPDLCPESDAVYVWHSTPTSTTLTINGSWDLVTPVEGVAIQSRTNTETLINVTMKEGEPVYFDLKDPNDTGIRDYISDRNHIRTERVSDGVKFIFDYPMNSAMDVKVVSVDGKVLFSDFLLFRDKFEYFIPKEFFTKGMNIVRLVYGGEVKTFKLIF